MIVYSTQTGWDVIYHRAHALLAAQLAGQWRRQESPPRLYETIAAVSHHDDLEREWEEHNLTNSGAPMDFTLNQTTEVNLLIDLVKGARYRGRWVALLISKHLSRLNEVKRGQSADLDHFLDQQQQQQLQWQQELGVSQEQVDSAYAFMQWCDRLSLILCQQQLPADERALEISKGPDGNRYDIVQQRDNRLTVTPWPFQDDEFTVNVEAAQLHQLKFDSSAELSEALQNAPIKVLEWTFGKSDRQ